MTPAPNYHLAQVNIGRGHATIDDPRMAGFVARLVEINALAERSAGFIWRLQDSGGDATSIRAYDDPRMLINLSVWESVEALFEFAYKSGHADPLRQRHAWFERMAAPTLALWWIPAGELPTVTEAVARLEHLAAHGPTPHAFDFRQRFPLPAEQAEPRSRPPA